MDSAIPLHVGNPINVASGNKYQYELDYTSFSSGLTLARHYNSNLSNYDVGFGPGWRHSYQLLLTRTGEDQLTMVQSDGRLIRFHRSADDSREELFLPVSASDGYLVSGERSTWHLPDGRRLVFQGSYLVTLDFGNHLGVLKLRYRAGKLLSVTDSRGDEISFQYISGTDSLPEYGSAAVVQPAGSVASVMLPDGEVIRYQYGAHRNLVGVQYPDEQAVGYGYHDEDWPNHLSLRQSSAEGRISEWRYDQTGQAITWIEGAGRNGLEIVRDSMSAGSGSSRSDASGAVVTYADGRRTRYVWAAQETGFHAAEGPFDIRCDNCLGGQIRSNESNDSGRQSAALESVVEDTEGSIASGQEHANRSSQPMDDAIARLWASLERSDGEFQGLSPEKNTHQGVYPHEQGDVTFKLTTDRKGRIKQMVMGEMAFTELARRSMSEQLPPCSVEDYLDNPEAFSHDRVQALGSGAEPCQLDAMVAVELIHKLEAYSSPDPDAEFETGEKQTRKKDVPWWSTMRRYCKMPEGKTCEDLADDLDMALLSRCAYGEYSCEPKYRLVAAEEIGFSNKQFHLDGFDAELYEDPATGQYILAFRGTDDIGDDWDVNFTQADGMKSRQYDLAVALGRDISERFPDADITFTGHSLGGGLATIAALETQRQATVFNAASFQPTTAVVYGLEAEYENAAAYVEHIHTRSDPVTNVQMTSEDSGFQLFPAPGQATSIPNPDSPWVNAVHADAEGFLEGFYPMIWHSMDAVVHVLESLIAFNCSS